jgi:hypothetical protein
MGPVNRRQAPEMLSLSFHPSIDALVTATDQFATT